MIPRTICLLMTILLCNISALDAKVRTKTIDYKHKDVALRGHLAWDDAISGPRPAVIVVHEWWGLNDYAKKRAEQLAKMGYVALAVDMYGKGNVTEHAQKAGEWSRQIQQNMDQWMKRAELGVNILKKNELVDSSRIAAIGYCFGGSTVLQMAYSGMNIKGVVSFHGSLPVAKEDQAKNIKAKILVCHGSEDAFIPKTRIEQFQATLDKAKADWQFIAYAGAKHSFTNPGSDSHGMAGLKYNKNADQRSWKHMKMFFNEIFEK